MQIKSRKRVQDHGEVFTNEREVNAMLDLVGAEAERLESRFLEPACGDGNFLAEVLRRKLATAAGRNHSDADGWQHDAFLAVSSVYGVEILPDNAEACRRRLEALVASSAPIDVRDEFVPTIRFLLSKNVLCADALTMLDSGGEPITFCEWSFVRGERVKRRDYQLSHMLDANARQGEQLDIFAGILNSEYDPSREELVPKAIREYPLRNWWEVALDG